MEPCSIAMKTAWLCIILCVYVCLRAHACDLSVCVGWRACVHYLSSGTEIDPWELSRHSPQSLYHSQPRDLVDFRYVNAEAERDRLR